jgi:hypothetical protein
MRVVGLVLAIVAALVVFEYLRATSDVDAVLTSTLNP